MLPIWFVKIDYRIIDVSVVNIGVSLLTSIYLVIINISLKGYSYDLIRIHILMFVVVALSIFLGYLGWSKLNMDTFWHPDGLTAGFVKFFLQFGEGIVVISLIISYIVKLIKNYR